MAEALSIFDIFKIGVGPSSSHTLGPWRAALHFIERLKPFEVNKIQIYLYGSLSKTGRGHATDTAVMLGLMGYDPITIDTNAIDSIIDEVYQTTKIKINDKEVYFNPVEHIVFENYEHKKHPNTLKFVAHTEYNGIIAEEDYTSVGGGFIECGTTSMLDERPALPFPVNQAVDLALYTESTGWAISDVVWQNELAFKQAEAIDTGIERLYETMLECIYQGCMTRGTLPGGLNVKRRAANISSTLLDGETFETREEWLNAIRSRTHDFQSINKWVSCFALAVNEQNASLNRVVTSPTNGAAGVIPAALLYFLLFCKNNGFQDIKRFFLTAGEIGALFKKGATISAAVGGCQAEIGVSSAMAAAALTEVKGGSADQCLMAAEIAMEHHLGLTCDPIAGLVQVPCIERNAMGAIKAITAANMALMSEAKDAIVKLDNVIETMWETAQDMSHKYKETSEGGLAQKVSVIRPNC